MKTFAGERLLFVDTTQYAPISPWFDRAALELEQRGRLVWRMVDTYGLSRPTAAGRVALLRRTRLHQALVKVARDWRPTRVIVIKGGDVGPSTVEAVRAATPGAVIVCLATDDPFNSQVSSKTLRAAISSYDMYITTKRLTVPDLMTVGARNISVANFAYKPTVHFPEPGPIRSEFESDVAFIGTYDKDRADLLAELTRHRSLRLRIWGGGWKHDRRLRALAEPVVNGRDFRLAVKGAKILLNFVRHSNRDDHSMRTFEIPACGGCMLSERTGPHEEWFAALPQSLFNGVEELQRNIDMLLASPNHRIDLAKAQRSWLLAGQHTYTDRLERMLRDAGAVSAKSVD